jgi:hypothetical protein
VESVSSMLLSSRGLSSYLGQDTEVKVSYCKNKIALLHWISMLEFIQKSVG